ncbi:MAG: MazG family protein [bacterium]
MSYNPTYYSKDTEGSFRSLVDIVAHLRSEEGCMWDREQTMESMKDNLLEEADEVIEAIEEKDMNGLCEELGDLLLQVVFYAQLAREEGLFTIDEVNKQIVEKLIRRHPHVFADTEVESTEEILSNWEKIKKNEKNI